MENQNVKKRKPQAESLKDLLTVEVSGRLRDRQTTHSNNQGGDEGAVAVAVGGDCCGSRGIN